MKIKTVVDNVANDFDKRVNAALEVGDVLTRRISDVPGPFIAELVLTDPIPERPDPWEALRAVKELCESISAEDCRTNKCPLHTWCDNVRANPEPTDWILPEREPET